MSHHTLTTCLLVTALSAAIARAEEAGSKHADSHAQDVDAHVENVDAHARPTGNHLEQASSHLRINGAIEIEAEFLSEEHGDESEEESALSVAAAELCIGATLNEWLSSELILLYEDGMGVDDLLDVESAVVNIMSPEESLIYAQLGIFYVPFGPLSTREAHRRAHHGEEGLLRASVFIAHPTTLLLAESRERALRVGSRLGILDISASAFNGEITTGGGREAIDNAVFNATLTAPMGKHLSLLCGAAYMLNMADTDELTELVEHATHDVIVADKVPGFNAFCMVQIGPVSLLAEYVAALEEFAAEDLGFDAEARPTALTAEVYARLPGSTGVGVKYERTTDCFDVLPEEVLGACATYELYEGHHVSAQVTLEYKHSTFDDDHETKEDELLARLAIHY